jgi:hypothetical protein
VRRRPDADLVREAPLFAMAETGFEVQQWLRERYGATPSRRQAK